MTTAQCVALNAGNGGSTKPTSAVGAGSTSAVAKSHGISTIARKDNAYLEIGGGVLICMYVGMLV